MRIAVVLLATEQVGGAQRCLERTVEYVNIRYQFGRPVGSFQAVKAPLRRHARSRSSRPAPRPTTPSGRWPRALDDAEISVGPGEGVLLGGLLDRGVRTPIQLHGGIAFTWEHDAHLYYRRAKSTSLLFGTPTEHWDAVAEKLLA